MKVVFIKDNFHVFFQISKKNYMKVIICKDDFHIIKKKKNRESCFL